MPGEAVETGSSAWATAMHVEDSDEALDAGSVLLVMDIWRLNQQMEDFCLSLFQISKYIKVTVTRNFNGP